MSQAHKCLLSISIWISNKCTDSSFSIAVPIRKNLVFYISGNGIWVTEIRIFSNILFLFPSLHFQLVSKFRYFLSPVTSPYLPLSPAWSMPPWSLPTAISWLVSAATLALQSIHTQLPVNLKMQIRSCYSQTQSFPQPHSHGLPITLGIKSTSLNTAYKGSHFLPFPPFPLSFTLDWIHMDLYVPGKDSLLSASVITLVCPLLGKFFLKIFVCLFFFSPCPEICLRVISLRKPSLVTHLRTEGESLFMVFTAVFPKAWHEGGSQWIFVEEMNVLCCL